MTLRAIGLENVRISLIKSDLQRILKELMMTFDPRGYQAKICWMIR